MKQWILICALAGSILVAGVSFAEKKAPARAKAKVKTVYQYKAKAIDGKQVALSTYRGKVLLIVNTASRCGYTPQYAGLQKLYTRYKSKGLVVLGFPANNFGGQEPGNNKQIKAFCSAKYKITFPMFSKVSVKGKDKHPLYDYLTKSKGEVTWNFNKFLVGKDGKVLVRFDSSITPFNKKLINTIGKHLK